MMRSFGMSGSRRLSLDEILQLSAVMICLDVRSQDIAKVAFRMYERMPGGGKREVEAEEHPVAFLLATRPNAFMTWNEFWTMVILHSGITEKRLHREADGWAPHGRTHSVHAGAHHDPGGGAIRRQPRLLCLRGEADQPA
jgi:hypothetical protein